MRWHTQPRLVIPWRGFLHGQKEKRAPLMRVWDGVTIWSFLNAMDFGNHRLFRPDATGYPAVLRRCTDGGHPPIVTAQGSLGVLAGTLIGFFCSVRCPGDIILKTYDLARALRRADARIIGGFQAAIEKEFLDILLRGTASVVICPAGARFWMASQFGQLYFPNSDILSRALDKVNCQFKDALGLPLLN